MNGIGFRLRKSDLRDETLVRDDSTPQKWISNGHWMALLRLINCEYVIDYTSSYSLEKIERAIPKDLSICVKMTGEIRNSTYDLDRSKDNVIFESEPDKDKVRIAFQRRYVEIFDLRTLYGKDPLGAWANEPKREDISAICMTIKI